jgi:hypothetical protein
MLLELLQLLHQMTFRAVWLFGASHQRLPSLQGPSCIQIFCCPGLFVQSVYFLFECYQSALGVQQYPRAVPPKFANNNGSSSGSRAIQLASMGYPSRRRPISTSGSCVETLITTMVQHQASGASRRKRLFQACEVSMDGEKAIKATAKA